MSMNVPGWIPGAPDKDDIPVCGRCGQRRERIRRRTPEHLFGVVSVPGVRALAMAPASTAPPDMVIPA